MLTRPVIATAVLLTLVLGAAGCARPGEPGAAPALAPSSSEVADPPAPSAEPPPAGAIRTITGTVVAGVEPGCLILQDATGSYLLIFDDPATGSEATPGARVTVVGRAEPGMVTTCQQGVPFTVASVQAR